MSKPKVTADKCPRGGNHTWASRTDETATSSVLTCGRCGHSFTVGRNLTPFADMEASR